MNGQPPPQLLMTFRAAVLLKLFGTLIAIGLGRYLIDQWVWNRWWMGLTTSGLLLLLLLPWPLRTGRITHRRLTLALGLGIVAPYLDLIQSTWVTFDTLLANPHYIERFNWTVADVNSIYALGLLFSMVAVVLASWQYGLRGLVVSLLTTAFFYLVAPLFMPDNAFAWGLYAIRGFVLLGVTLILAFTVGALAAAGRREQENLAAANAKLAVANQKLAAHAATLEQLATSRERNRLARELHDTLAHALSGTAIQLQAISTLLTVAPDEAAAELKLARQQIRAGLEEARRAIAALRASPIESLGLAEALRGRAAQLSARMGIPIDCHIHDDEPLPPLVEQTIYRVADEALHNAEKHAAAGRMSLALTRAGGAGCLTVRDDGAGFDPAAVAGQQYGLLGLRERAELIGAELTVDSAPGRGTTIQLRFEWP